MFRAVQNNELPYCLAKFGTYGCCDGNGPVCEGCGFRKGVVMVIKEVPQNNM